MSKPVLPGQTLVTEMWQEGETVSVAKVKEKVKEAAVAGCFCHQSVRDWRELLDGWVGGNCS